MRKGKKPDRSRRKARESGLPGGGAGRKDEVGKSGVYPMSGPHPAGDAPIVTEPAWGQGERGAAGYEDHGASELSVEVQPVTPELCRDVMTKDPVCCLTTDTVYEAARLMRVHDAGSLPVVSEEDLKTLAGIVTDRDLALRVIAERRDPDGTRVEEIMTAEVATCLPEARLEQVLEEMERRQVRRIPVVDNRGRVVGIVAQADIALRVPEPARTAEVVQEISRPKLQAA
jgi:CBS domain-containing protein